MKVICRSNYKIQIDGLLAGAFVHYTRAGNKETALTKMLGQRTRLARLCNATTWWLLPFSKQFYGHANAEKEVMMTRHTQISMWHRRKAGLFRFSSKATPHTCNILRPYIDQSNRTDESVSREMNHFEMRRNLNPVKQCTLKQRVMLYRVGCVGWNAVNALKGLWNDERPDVERFNRRRLLED